MWKVASFVLVFVVLIFVLLFVVEPSVPNAVTYPDHSNLLIVRDAQGNETPVKTSEDWQKRLAHVRANMQVVMGPLPDNSRRVPLQPEYGPEDVTDKYIRRKVTITPEPDDRVS